MKWEETIASECRYGDVAERLFGKSEVIWENSENDYQGHANVFVALPSGRFAHYEWTYGSCSGCDEWEDRCLSNDQIEEIMRDETVWFDTIEVARKYLHLNDGSKSPWYSTNYDKMGKAFDAWLVKCDKVEPIEFDCRIISIEGDTALSTMKDEKRGKTLIAKFLLDKLSEKGINGEGTRFKYTLTNQNSNIISWFTLIPDIVETQSEAYDLWQELCRDLD